MEELKLTSIVKTLVAAGDAILDIYKGENYKTSIKNDSTPVTIADKTSSKIINEGLRELYPQIPILDEEKHIPDYEIRKDWVKFFIIDPLDGTKEFIKQNGEFCINLALIENGKPTFGWIYHPLTQRGWFCEKGKGIFEFDKTGIKTKIEKPVKPSNTIRIIGSRSFFKPKEKELIDKIRKDYKVEIIHRGSSIKQVAIILGQADIYLKAGPCSEWDTAPGQLFIEEFGGSVIRLDNFQHLSYNKPVLKNPHFVMLNEYYNKLEFIESIQKYIQN